MNRNGTTAIPMAVFLDMAYPAERPMMVAKTRSMPTTEVKNRGRRPNRSTLTAAHVAMTKFQIAERKT